MKSIKPTVIVLTTLMLAALGIGTKAQAQTKNTETPAKGSIELIKSEYNDNSFVRANAQYSLPLGISGSSFMEFYKDERFNATGSSYFGKTTLSLPIATNLNNDPTQVARATGQIVCGNNMTTHAGIGVSLEGKVTPSTFMKGYVIPKYINTEGKFVDDKAVAGYFISQDITSDINVSSFGEVNIAAPAGPQWGYGQINVTYTLNKNNAVKAGVELKNKGPGEVIPKTHLCLTYELKIN